jgi:hypothetical protein
MHPANSSTIDRQEPFADLAIPAIPEVPPALREAAQLTKLIPFVGAGASKLAGCPDWNEWRSLWHVISCAD